MDPRNASYAYADSKTGTQRRELRTSGEELQDLEPDQFQDKHYATAYDVRDMAALGLAPVFRRRFKFVAMVGFSSTVVVAWQNVMATFSFALFNGGTGGLFWGFVFALFGMGFVYLTISELSSCFPTAGGQYQWVAECAPPSAHKLLSYCTGWLCTLAWITFLASAAVVVGNLTKYCILVYYPNSTTIAGQWFSTVLALASLVVGGIFNTYLTKRFPALESIMLFIHLASWAAIVVTLWVTSPIGDAHEVLFTFENGGGWPNAAIATLVGVLTPWTSVMGYDSSVHMTENAQDASKVIPWSLMTAFVLNGVMAFVIAATLIFCAGDLTEILSNPNQNPFILIFLNSTGSKAATILMTVPIILCFMSAIFSQLATASRQLWSFARDGGLPFSKQLRTVYDSEVPRRAVWTVIFLCCVLSCVNFGPVAGFNAIVSLVASALTFSYAITTACVLWRRYSGRPLPRERFTLGAFGVYINLAALACVAPLTILTLFPAEPNPVPAYMNWAALMFGAVIIFATVYYILVGRKQFSPVLRKEE